VIRIAVIGPESTGKSHLSKYLSKQFNCPVIEEYAREYLSKLNRPYTFQDVEKIALEQMKQEDIIVQSKPEIIIVDTELIVIKIWMEHKWSKTPLWLEEKINERKYDLYLLCNTDLGWEYDPLRENPDSGDYFFNLFHQELITRKVNFEIISGNENERVATAIQLVNKIQKANII